MTHVGQNGPSPAPRDSRPRRRGRGAMAGVLVAGVVVATVSTASPTCAQVAPEPSPTSAPSPTTAPATQPVGARRPATIPGVTEQGGGLVLNFQDASIDVVLDELSGAAGFIVVKEAKPTGRVTLVSKKPVNAADAVSLLNTVLRNNGFAAIRQERILKIVARDVAKRLNIPVRTGNEPEQVANTDELITQVIPLRFANATQLKTDLQPLVNPEADFASNASSNALVITDTSANVRRVVQIVKALDTSLADAVDVKVLQLKFANAAQTATLINSVFGNIDASRGTGNADANAQGGQGAARGGNNPGGGGGNGGNEGPGGFFRRMMQQQQGSGGQQGQGSASQKGKVSAGADERTNSVVISGPPDTLAIVSDVLKELDSNPAAEETVFVYRLLNAQAVNVEGVLNSLFNGTTAPQRTVTSNADLLRQARNSRASSNGSIGNFSTGNTRTTGGGVGGGGGMVTGGTYGGGLGGQSRLSAGSQSSAAGLAGQVSLIADVDSNSLIVRTSPTNYARVKKILEEIDRAVPQVLIKVLVAEVTHDSGSDVGAELSALNVKASNPDGSVAAGGGSSIGGNFGIPVSATDGTGLVLQVMETNFTATIRALETAGKLEVLSRPYILASDNQLASITVGQEVPRIVSSSQTDAGLINSQVDYDDIGILLDVIPHINPDGLVILDVAPEISSLTGQSIQVQPGVSQPVIAKRSAQSRVSVRTGETIVIGGLMEDRVTSTIRRVPILGYIPIIGELFKRRQNTKAKTELLIFLTPHVASDPRLLKGMSDDEVKGTKLLPKAVSPKVYKEHVEGLQRGAPERSVPATAPVVVPLAVPNEPDENDAP